MLEVIGDVYCLGDPHGDWDVTIDNIIEQDIKDCSLFVLGDCALGWFSDYSFDTLVDLQDICSERNIKVYMIRGNHDNPEVWFNEEIRTRVNKLYPNIIVLNSSIISINGHQTLILGGATSIDRIQRIEDTSWWRNENLSIPVMEKEDLKNIDTILSHTCFAPEKVDTNSAVEIFAKYDKNLLQDLKSEQELYWNIVRDICDTNLDLSGKKLKIVYGHFHINLYDTSTKYNNITIELNCLGIQKIKKLEYGD